MTIPLPLGPLAAVERSLLIRRAGAATVVTILVQFATGWALRVPEAPYGIMSLELTGSIVGAQEILTAWEARGLTGLATANVVADYSFLVSYATLLVVLCVTVGERRGTAWAETTGRIMGWGQWLAGALDAIENIALLSLLAGARLTALTALSAAAAGTKFSLVGLGLAWVIGAESTRRLVAR